MRNFINKTNRLADHAGLFLANLAAIVLLFLVVLTVADVIGRYVFTRPVTGTVELVQISMAGIIFFSFPLMFLRNDHIIVDLVPIFRSGRIAWVSAVVILLLTIYVAYKVGDRTFDYAVRAFEDEDITEYLSIPRWPIVGFITLSLFAAAVSASLRLLRILTTPGQLPPEHHEEGI